MPVASPIEMGQARKFVTERQQWIVADVCVCEQRFLLFFVQHSLMWSSGVVVAG